MRLLPLLAVPLSIGAVAASAALMLHVLRRHVNASRLSRSRALWCLVAMSFTLLPLIGAGALGGITEVLNDVDENLPSARYLSGEAGCSSFLVVIVGGVVVGLIAAKNLRMGME